MTNMCSIGRWAAILVLVFCTGASAAVNEWTGTGNWTNVAGWSLGHVPASDEDALISADILVTNAPGPMQGLTVAVGSTMTFSGWSTIVTATTVNIEGTLTHPLNSDTNAPWVPDNRVYLSCSNCTIDGSIDIKEKGYGNNAGGTTGYGPGAPASSSRGSAAHGGTGGGYSASTNTYGSTNAPTDPGSGGSGNYGGVGKPGGGVVRILATGTVTIDGFIDADGGSISGQGGGASGGSVYITCRVFAGNGGLITAKGGNATDHGGGGGGRIAIYCDTVAQTSAAVPRVNLSARYGYGATGTGNGADGQHGSLHVSDWRLLPETMADCYGCLYELPSGVWNASQLVATNSGLIFEEALELAVANDLSLASSTFELTAGGDLTVGGDLSLSGSTLLDIRSAATNGVSSTNGALVTVTGHLLVGDGSTLLPRTHSTTNGGAVLFHVGELTIDTGGSIDADGYGYPGKVYGSNGGYGPGAGTGDRCCASHGGLGGGTPPSGTGPTYGSSNAPIEPGSSGASKYSQTDNVTRGADGGGVVWVESQRDITVNGTISANGDSITKGLGGAAAGGSIYLRCETLSGGAGARLSADGGNQYSSSSGAGGGGRIALYRINDTFLGTVSADGGINTTNATRSASNGTVVLVDLPGPPAGTVISIR